MKVTCLRGTLATSGVGALDHILIGDTMKNILAVAVAFLTVLATVSLVVPIVADAADDSPARTAPAGEHWVMPKDAGHVNVRDFGATGDGTTDDTAALRKAISHALANSIRYGAPRFIYLPDGTYRVTGPIESRVLPEDAMKNEKWNRWRAGMNLIGESRDGTVIQLADAAEGYGDASEPRGVIITGSEAEDKKQNAVGEGNRAFRHYIRNLTIDTGKGNAGAVGIDYVVSNRGSIEDVTIRSGDPQRVGYAGVRMERAWPGPAMLQRVRVEGFDHGLIFGHHQYGMTLEDIGLTGQRKAGLYNKGNAVYLLGLVSDNSVPAVVSEDTNALVVLIDSKLVGGGGDAPAIRYEGNLFARNVETAGYQRLIDAPKVRPADAGVDVPVGSNTTIKQYASHTASLAGGGDAESLALPIERAPRFHDADSTKWANVTAFGATVTPFGDDKEKDDDAPGVQAAIDSGAQVVYLPNGGYSFESPVIIRGNVRKIIGMAAAIKRRGEFDTVFQFDTCGGDSVILEHLRFDGDLVHNSDKTLVFRHGDFRGKYRNTQRGTGKLFFEDVIGRGTVIGHGQHAWLRQYDAEWGFDPWLENHGSTLWVLGMKTEGNTTAIHTQGGGRTELLGGLFYRESRWKGPKDSPLFTVAPGSHFSASYVNNGQAYPVQLQVSEEPVKLTDGPQIELKAIHKRGIGLLSAQPELTR